MRTAPQFAPGLPVRGWTRDRLDLTDWEAVRRAFQEDRPTLVFHCAALSRSPDCEAQPDRARLNNVEVTAHLAQLCKDAVFVFLSTDQVFDGSQGSYAESDAPNPLNVYGRTKRDSEAVVLSNPRHLAIRTSLNGGTSPSGDRGFNEQLRHLWKQGREVRLFVDEFRSPIGAEVTARALWELALGNHSGLFHVGGTEKLSRWEIGSLLAARWPELHPKVSAGSLGQFEGPPRAPDTSLDCSKAQRVLKTPLPRFSDWLSRQPPGSF